MYLQKQASYTTSDYSAPLQILDMISEQRLVFEALTPALSSPDSLPSDRSSSEDELQRVGPGMSYLGSAKEQVVKINVVEETAKLSSTSTRSKDGSMTFDSAQEIWGNGVQFLTPSIHLPENVSQQQCAHTLLVTTMPPDRGLKHTGVDLTDIRKLPWHCALVSIMAVTQFVKDIPICLQEQEYSKPNYLSKRSSKTSRACRIYGNTVTLSPCVDREGDRGHIKISRRVDF
ncbi:hypothetical protein BDV93DRAFT_511380 [Ceratobasidium sp. AG-I]|nr:hypothetical protein BDV93DRAFT_511380 [Ceratobasidium sp. AG-I]